MNAIRRKEIRTALEAIAIAKETIETMLQEEQDAFDNLPESLQSGTNGEKMSEGIESLESAISSIDDALENIESALV